MVLPIVVVSFIIMKGTGLGGSPGGGPNTLIRCQQITVGGDKKLKLKGSDGYMVMDWASCNK